MKIDITFINNSFLKLNNEIIEFLKEEIDKQESTDKTINQVSINYTENDYMIEIKYDDDGNMYVSRIDRNM